MKERILLILIFLHFILPTHSFANYAKVILVRGKVTQLAPGELIARKVSKGEELKMDTSILTEKGSFVRLNLKDGSVLSLGPESKLVLSKIGESDKDQSVINLLKGTIRNKIKKSQSGKMNYFIKTRTAALGVRGTEFEAVYGSESGVTSLLTYKGSVSMAHIRDVLEAKKKEVEDVEYSRESEYDKSIVIEESTELKKGDDPIEQMELALNHDKASTVKAGQISQTVDAMDTVARPAVINPVQLNLLYENDEFKEGSGRRPIANLDDDKLKIQPVATDSPAEGIYDKERGIYAPKSGGFFDRKTGLYIPPSSDALYDQKNKVYVDKQLGNVDAKTGEYVPPLGLEIDPKVGFVKKRFKASTPKAILAKVDANQRKLNSVLDHSIVVGDGPDKEEEREVKYYLSYRELIAKNVFNFSIEGYDQDFDVEESSEGSYSNNSDGATRLNLSLDFDSGSRLRPYVQFSLAFNDFHHYGDSRFSQEGNKLTAFGAGLTYSMSPHWNLFSQIKMDQQFIMDFENSDNGIFSQLVRFSLPKISFGIQGEWFRYKKLSGEAGALIGLNLSKESGDIEVSMGRHYQLNTGLRYWPSRNWYLNTSLFVRGESYDVEGTSYNYSYKGSRHSSGLNLGFGTYF